MENRIAADLTDDVVTEVLKKIDEIRSLLPFLIDLTPEERQELPKMGERNRAFTERALELAREDDSYLPRSFVTSEMEQYVNLASGLRRVETALTRLGEQVSDTLLATGSEAYSSALVVYGAAKRDGRGAALDSLVDALGRRFGRKTGDEPPANPPA
ncbi:MAG TPA: hypothetical protein VEX64_01460 [Pyrinomonadaceae bacterium]|nr:hypothetical protein [Pyrinomonadaceae bacterium]